MGFAMIVKLMSGEDLADEDSRKSFRLIANVVEVEFERAENAHGVLTAYAVVTRNDDDPEDSPEAIELDGTVYVMNQAGKTVATFGPASPDSDLGVVATAP